MNRNNAREELEVEFSPRDNTILFRIPGTAETFMCGLLDFKNNLSTLPMGEQSSVGCVVIDVHCPGDGNEYHIILTSALTFRVKEFVENFETTVHDRLISSFPLQLFFAIIVSQI